MKKQPKLILRGRAPLKITFHTVASRPETIPVRGEVSNHERHAKCEANALRYLRANGFLPRQPPSCLIHGLRFFVGAHQGAMA